MTEISLRDNLRELTVAELDEVAGGSYASVGASWSGGAGGWVTYAYGFTGTNYAEAYVQANNVTGTGTVGTSAYAAV